MTDSIERRLLQIVLDYVNHVGLNAVVLGQPHPQQWLVDGLIALLAQLEQNAAGQEKKAEAASSGAGVMVDGTSPIEVLDCRFTRRGAEQRRWEETNMTYVRIRFEKLGGHYHCRLFTSQNYDGTFANCGELTFDEREFADVRDKLSRCEWVEDGNGSYRP